MTKQDFQTILHESKKRLHTDSVSQKIIQDSAYSLMGMILDAEQLNKNKFENEIEEALNILEYAQSLLKSDNILNEYVKSFICYKYGKYDDYLKYIDIFIRNYINEYNSISYEYATLHFFDIFNIINVDMSSEEYNKFFSKFYSILKKRCSNTAFELYVKYCISKTSNYNLLEKYLLKVLKKDNQWAIAYKELGNIYYQKKDWIKAIQYYEKAKSVSDLQKTDSLYFNLAWSYSKNKDYKKEEAAYRECLQITPSFPNANNNLGYSLVKQKRYEEALAYFDISMEIKTDKYYPYRNKFNALMKIGRKKEAIDFIRLYPQYFNTKYYRDQITKLTGDDVNLLDLFSKLNDITESDFAGEIMVTEGKSGISLYPHQKEAIQKMNEIIIDSSNYAGLLVLPTGGGKTLTATYWLMQNLLDKGKKIIWLAHRHELLNQAKNSFDKVCYRDVTQNKLSYNWRIISGQHDKPIHIKSTDDIIIASKTSLKRGMEYFVNNWLKKNGDNAFLIIDEAHHATASEYRSLIQCMKENSKHFKMLGLTATPFRTADSEQGLLKNIFPDDIAYKIDLRELINLGILSEPIFKSISTDVNMSELFQISNSEEALKRIVYDNFFDINSIGKETATAIANNSKRNNAIVNEYIKNKDNYKQTLVFALNVDMAIVLNGLFNAAGIRSDYVVSAIKDMATQVTISNEENGIKIQKFRDGELDVLVNVNILTEGTDLPKVQSVFLTRPTKSTILMTQMIGRALRGEKAGGTKEAYIVSFIDNWQDKIAWVNPEQLFIDENVDFTKKDHETQKLAMRLVSIAKIEEFAKIANDTLDSRLSDIAFVDRIPIGIYKFSYLVEDTNDEELDKSCNILVYDCMKDAYASLIAWFPTADLTNVEELANHIDETLFGSLDLLLGYSKQDIIDLIRYYKQTQEMPQLIYLTERKDYDITTIAQYIINNPVDKKEYIKKEWDRSDMHWSAFFGINNQKTFRKLINNAIDQIEYPEDYIKSEIQPITQKEKIQVLELNLFEIRQRFPEVEEKIRNAVFAKYTDIDGYYYSAMSGFRSKNRLDFQIDHIKPMSQGGLTVPENLQLLTRNENLKKSDR